MYHSAELASTVVITRDLNNNGTLEIRSALALDMTAIDCLSSPETIFIFDAKAQEAREPPLTDAFLILTSSRNIRSYAQTMRTNIKFYGIPSYSLTELLGICHYFGMAEDEVVRRCVEIGPSFRYILVMLDFKLVLKRVEDVIEKVDPANISAYMENTSVNTDNVSACLLKLRVENSTDMVAYEDENLTWDIASKNIAMWLVKRKNEDARRFVQKFVAESLNNPKLKGVAGNYMEIFVPEFIAAGKYTKRELEKPRLQVRVKRSRSSREIAEEKRKKWEIVDQFTIFKVSDALRECTRVNALYNFSGTFPAITYSAKRFRELFQVTVSAQHSIVLDAILEICEFVKNNFQNGTVNLYFVVPSSVSNSYKDWQSFKTREDGKEVRRSLVELPDDVQAQLSNLKQYVIQCDL